jgi:hypothetical protein
MSLERFGGLAESKIVGSAECIQNLLDHGLTSEINDDLPGRATRRLNSLGRNREY